MRGEGGNKIKVDGSLGILDKKWGFFLKKKS